VKGVATPSVAKAPIYERLVILLRVGRSIGASIPEAWRWEWYLRRKPCIVKNTVPKWYIVLYTNHVEEDGRVTYRISEAARELGISIEWLRAGEKRGFFRPALRDHNGHRYYTEEDIERVRNRRRSRKIRG